MSGMTHAAASYVGSRVQWIAGPQTGYVMPDYWKAVASGERRLPTAAERRELRTGEDGTVTELVSVTAAGHTYAIRFSGGYELETILPAPALVRFLDDAALPAPSGRAGTRYAPAGPRTPLGRLAQAVIRGLRRMRLAR